QAAIAGRRRRVPDAYIDAAWSEPPAARIAKALLRRDLGPVRVTPLVDARDYHCPVGYCAHRLAHRGHDIEPLVSPGAPVAVLPRPAAGHPRGRLQRRNGLHAEGSVRLGGLLA